MQCLPEIPALVSSVPQNLERVFQLQDEQVGSYKETAATTATTDAAATTTATSYGEVLGCPMMSMYSQGVYNNHGCESEQHPLGSSSSSSKNTNTPTILNIIILNEDQGKLALLPLVLSWCF